MLRGKSKGFLFIESLNLFPEGEEHQIPSIREWERRIFETKGKVSEEEVREIFEKLGPEEKKGENENEMEKEKEKDVKNEENKDEKSEKESTLKNLKSKFQGKKNFAPDFELVTK